MSQEARISVNLRFADQLESQMIQSFSSNATKVEFVSLRPPFYFRNLSQHYSQRSLSIAHVQGRQAMEHVITKLEREVRELAEGIIVGAAQAICEPDEK